MSTRSIVTSQPDIACDVCERRLLRGEQSDVFLTAGERRTVCELCAPRAMHEGWLRETDYDSVEMPLPRPRRRRGLFDRLRQGARPPGRSPQTDPDDSAVELTSEDPFDELSGPQRPRAAPAPARPTAGQPFDRAGEHPPRDGSPASEALIPSEARDARAERAVEAFNAGAHPRRISGLARSLGEPGVCVRPDEDVQHLVSIAVAWELCWYRYEIDVDEPDGHVEMVEQGTELDELAPEDRLVNAVADDRGALSLSVG